MKYITLFLNSIEHKIACEKIKGKTWYHINGETFCYEPQVKSRQNDAQSTKSGIIKAPMPGKIIKLNVQQKDMVSKGKVLVVLEAMKMEYSLEADVDGCVNLVNCSIGDQVLVDQLLIEIRGGDEPKS